MQEAEDEYKLLVKFVAHKMFDKTVSMAKANKNKISTAMTITIRFSSKPMNASDTCFYFEELQTLIDLNPRCAQVAEFITADMRKLWLSSTCSAYTDYIFKVCIEFPKTK